MAQVTFRSRTFLRGKCGTQGGISRVENDPPYGDHSAWWDVSGEFRFLPDADDGRMRVRCSCGQSRVVARP